MCLDVDDCKSLQVIALIGSYGGKEVWGDAKKDVLAKLAFINFVSSALHFADIYQ